MLALLPTVVYKRTSVLEYPRSYDYASDPGTRLLEMYVAVWRVFFLFRKLVLVANNVCIKIKTDLSPPKTPVKTKPSDTQFRNVAIVIKS